MAKRLATNKKKKETPQLPSPVIAPAIAEVPMHVETRSVREDIKPPREWVSQPDQEIGMHGTVAHTFRVLHAEIAECERRIAENKLIVKRMKAEQAKFYKIPHDSKREMTFNDDYSILLVPQFEKPKEMHPELNQEGIIPLKEEIN